MAFESRSHVRHLVHVVGENDIMRVSHRDKHSDFRILVLAEKQLIRYFRFQHIHADRLHHSFGNLQFQNLYSRFSQ